MTYIRLRNLIVISLDNVHPFKEFYRLSFLLNDLYPHEGSYHFDLIKVFFLYSDDGFESRQEN